LAKHRAVSPAGDSTDAHRHPRQGFDPHPAEITEIIPLSGFGRLSDLGADTDFYGDAWDDEWDVAFDRESEVVSAPELDDLDPDAEAPLRLVVPSEFRPDPRDERPSGHAYRDSHTDVSDGTAATDVIAIGRRGQHRKPEPTSAGKGRLMIAAMAAGATAAGAYSVVNGDDEKSSTDATVLAADQAAMPDAIDGATGGMQIVTVAQPAKAIVHAEEITKAAAFAQERAEREARLARPQFVMPTTGVWTSGFGYRWGVLHGGIDIANSVGTPILAAADGVVIETGPQGGYGIWVKLRHYDGTVTVYAHLSSVLVNVGQRVMAGDQIARMGNTGNSTGPHLHFEVLLDGVNRVDPAAWLAKRGVGPNSGYMR
jgi:murein DD-endopeptidase MepM/ murein hydrolase activator NlpD